MNVAVPSRSVLERLSAFGAGTQALIPGLYAWALTVANVGFASNVSSGARWTALAGLVALVGGAVVTRKGSRFGSIVSIWGLVLSALVTWALAISSNGALPLDWVRVLAGLVGWGLFGFASAAPAVQKARVGATRPLLTKDPRDVRASRWVDSCVLGASSVLALLLQTIGWDTKTFERAVLIRLILVCAGIAVIGAGADVAVARHARGSKKTRVLVRATLPLVFTTIFVIAAVLVGANPVH